MEYTVRDDFVYIKSIYFEEFGHRHILVIPLPQSRYQIYPSPPSILLLYILYMFLVTAVSMSSTLLISYKLQNVILTRGIAVDSHSFLPLELLWKCSLHLRYQKGENRVIYSL